MLDSHTPTADDTPVATAKNMPGDSADLFGDSAADDGSAANGRLWRTVIIGEQEHRIDLHMIRPYMKVVTHGGVCTPRPRPHEVTADSGSPNGGPVQLGCAGAGTLGIISPTGRRCSGRKRGLTWATVTLTGCLLPRVLRGRPQRHHCLRSLLPPRQQLP